MRTEIGLQKLLRLAREERGAELVEFAIAGLIVVVLLCGIVLWAYTMYAYHFTAYAAQEATQFAAVRGYTWSSRGVTTNCSTSSSSFSMPYNCTAQQSDITNYVDSLALGLSTSGIQVTTTWPGTNADGGNCGTYPNASTCLVQVEVSYTLNYLPLGATTAFTISSTSEKTIMQ